MILTPAAAAILDKSLVVLGSIVEQSIHSVFFVALGKTSSVYTLRTWGLLGSIVTTASASEAASAALEAAVAPRLTSSWTGFGLTVNKMVIHAPACMELEVIYIQSNTDKVCPAFVRFTAMCFPMLPKPMNPI